MDDSGSEAGHVISGANDAVGSAHGRPAEPRCNAGQELASQPAIALPGGSAEAQDEEQPPGMLLSVGEKGGFAVARELH